MEKELKIKINKGGPYLVSGEFKLVLPSGEEKEMTGNTFLCRCGRSGKKPFCDGSHKSFPFDE
ncbi:MAG: CDGSH iron-sulfur domain-containing protein [Paludibacteraceae bacterium]